MKKKKSKRKLPTSQLANNNQVNKKSKSKYERRQERYLKTKRNEKAKRVPDKLSKLELENWKKQLEPLVSEANKRIELIESAGYMSYALDRVIKEGGSDYFDLEPVSNREELLREITRMRVFINDNGSTIEGAKLETAQIYASEYKGKFGNEYNNEEHNFSRFDTSTIDKEVAKRAFANYRRIEEHRAAEIVGDGSYGSENLIIALYDAEIRGLDSLAYGEELLDTLVKTQSDMWKRATAKSNMITGITGIIEDNITGRRLF
jgi:hypothetical protein